MWVDETAGLEIEQRQESMRSLYRRFADQFIETQKIRGAP